MANTKTYSPSERELQFQRLATAYANSGDARTRNMIRGKAWKLIRKAYTVETNREAVRSLKYPLIEHYLKEAMICNDCNHEQHRPGQCGNCNCGLSDISTLTAPVKVEELSFIREAYMPKVTIPGVNCGHRVKPKRTDA